jgi:hypothetical protein
MNCRSCPVKKVNSASEAYATDVDPCRHRKEAVPDRHSELTVVANQQDRQILTDPCTLLCPP